MEKRLPLALFLSLLVVFGWAMLFPPARKPIPPAPEPGALEPAAAAPSAMSAAEAAPPAIADDLEREIELRIGAPAPEGGPARMGTYRARFSNRGACLLQLDLGDYVKNVGLSAEERLDPANWLTLVESVETSAGRRGSLVLRTSASSRDLAPLDLDQALWQMAELEEGMPGVSFRYAPAGRKVIFEKRITFEPGTWRIHLEVGIENVDAGAGGPRSFALVPAACVPPELGDTFYKEPRVVAIGRAPESASYELDWEAAPGLRKGDALDVPLPLVLVGEHIKYFAFLLREADASAGTLHGATYTPVHEVGRDEPRALVQVEVPLALTLPPPGERRSWSYVVYAGPKDPLQFAADFSPPHQLVLDEDLSVATVAKALLRVLRFFHGLVGNWGVAIILLTLCVRLALFPLNRRAQTAMARYQKKMKRVQPKLEEIKARYADDPQKLREAQARIMQEERAFPPLGGCLPVFLQMPVFIGLYSALRTSFDLRQAPFFGWIHDLSCPDRLLELDLRLPLLPDVRYLNLLPILMVVLWVLQQRGMPKPADEQAARMQKMMMFMPVVFGVMLYNYAAGLSLYMITTSGCSIVEQKVIRKLWPIDDSEQETRRKGCGPFSGTLQHLADKQREHMKRMQAMQDARRPQSSKQVRRRKRK